MATGLEFLAMVPFFNFVEKGVNIGRNALDAPVANKTKSGNNSMDDTRRWLAEKAGHRGGVRLEVDGRVTMRASAAREPGAVVLVRAGDLPDADFFLRYLRVPRGRNYNNVMPLKLPGAVPTGSLFHQCVKGTRKQRNSDACLSHRSESLHWRSTVLTQWRKELGLPPRMQELRLWANRLHLYGSGETEMRLQSRANQVRDVVVPCEFYMPVESTHSNPIFSHLFTTSALAVVARQ